MPLLLLGAVVLATVATAATVATVATAAGETPVFVPANETFLKGLVEDGVAPGCRWLGTKIGPQEAMSTLGCPGDATVQIRLAPPEAKKDGDVAAGVFVVGFDAKGTLPPELRERFLERVRERSKVFQWVVVVPGRGGDSGRRARKEYSLKLVAIAGAVLLVGAGIWLARQRS